MRQSPMSLLVKRTANYRRDNANSSSASRTIRSRMASGMRGQAVPGILLQTLELSRVERPTDRAGTRGEDLDLCLQSHRDTKTPMSVKPGCSPVHMDDLAC